MALFGVNFNFYFFCLIHEWKEAFHMEEVQTYFKVIGFSTLFIAINILPLIHGGFIDAVRLAFFPGVFHYYYYRYFLVVQFVANLL